MAYQSRVRAVPSIWGFGGGRSYPPGWALGLLTPYHTIVSRAYLPTPTDRRALGANRQPFWHVINHVLGARGTLDNNIFTDENFVLLALMATSQEVDSFRSQSYQLVTEDTGARMSRIGVNQSNFAGTGERPFFLKRPYPMPNGRRLLNRTGNRINAANTVQLVFYGVKDFSPETK